MARQRFSENRMIPSHKIDSGSYIERFKFLYTGVDGTSTGGQLLFLIKCQRITNFS